MDYNARWYSPSLGRFTQPDTIIPSFANPQSLNRYSYVFNNPINANDPSGHRPAGACEDSGGCEPGNDLARATRKSEVIRRTSPCREKPWHSGCNGNSSGKRGNRQEPPGLNYNILDIVPGLSDIRAIARGTENAVWASNLPGFSAEQDLRQSYWDNCMGQCHYPGSAPIHPGMQVGGAAPSTPVADFFDFSMGEVASGATNLLQMIAVGMVIKPGGGSPGTPGTPDFIGTNGGDIIPIPENSIYGIANNGKGFRYSGGTGGNGLHVSITDVRIMYPTDLYPTGYTVYARGPQAANLYTGQTLSRTQWHIVIDLLGGP